MPGLGQGYPGFREFKGVVCFSIYNLQGHVQDIIYQGKDETELHSGQENQGKCKGSSSVPVEHVPLSVGLVKSRPFDHVKRTFTRVRNGDNGP